MRAAAHFFSFFIVAILGWTFGSLYPAPPRLIAHVYPQALAARATDDFRSIQSAHAINLRTIQGLLDKGDAARITSEAVHVAEQAGHVITIEHQTDEATKDAEQAAQPVMDPAIALVPLPTAPLTQSPPPLLNPATPQLTAAVPNLPVPAATHPGSNTAVLASSLVQTQSTTTTTTTITATQAVVPAGAAVPQGFEAVVLLCPGMQITDAPAAEPDRRIENFSPLIKVNGDTIAVDPIRVACLSSGFGSREGKLHKGIDFYNGGGGPILAAGDGTIIEMKYRDDYGNMIIIDHGNGVYTRYAHLSSFHTGLALGSTVHAGEEIGLMGNTAGYPVPMHLHYELLIGDYKNPKASFGLAPHSPFEYKAAAL